MIAIQGYFDGTQIQPLGQVIAKPNQRVIITVLDEYVEPAETVSKKRMRGILSQYADPALAKQEDGAWKRTAAEK